MLPPLLFRKMDIYSVCENQKRSLQVAAASLPEPSPSTTDEEVIAMLVARFDVDVPILHDDQMTFSEKEVDIDVSGDPRRVFIRRGVPFYIKGTQILVHIPFSGEAAFFDVQPSTFTFSPPRGEIVRSELLLRFEYANDTPPPDLKTELEGKIREVKSNLAALRESTDRLKTELKSVAENAWKNRKLQFSSKSQVIAGLGLPRREEAHRPRTSPAAAKHVVPRPAKEVTSDQEHVSTSWHVFISHASEDKEAIARPLADALIAAGFSVWYDDYTLNVGDSLRQKIDEGLSKSNFGIVILSKAFFAKHWPQQELNGLATRENQGKKVILPIWHDISRDDVTAASPMLADRLAVTTSLGIDPIVTRLIKAMSS